MKKLTILFSGMFIGVIATAQTPISITAIALNYNQDFNTLDTITTAPFNTNLPIGWQLLEAGANADNTYRAGKGTSATGDTYSFGASSSDRALGGLASGTITPGFSIAFTNNTGTTISSINISCQGEQWRLGSANSATDTLKFMYSTNATNLTDPTATWITSYQASVTSIITSGSIGSLDGDQNSITINDTINVNVPDGSSFYMKWIDVNISGSDDALAIDDLNLVFIPGNTTNMGDLRNPDANFYVLGTTTNNDLTLALNVAEGKYNLCIYDLGGKTVYNEEVIIYHGTTQKHISDINLPCGMYLAKLRGCTKTYHTKLNIN